MSADMWRVPSPSVSFGSAYSVIQDNGVLTHALPSSLTGNYLFSEHGAGVKPLALIGMQHEIARWLTIHRDIAIDNRIADLPDIYMDMCYYTPGQRYRGLFPLHDAAAQAAQGAIALGGAMVPSSGGMGSVAANTGNVASSGVGFFRRFFGRKKKPPVPTTRTHRVYILFTYHQSIRDRNLLKLGSGMMKFRDVERNLLQAMKMI